MALSVVDLYRTVLPKTNCKDCGFPTCLSFASMVVSEQHPLKNCPHIDPELLAKSEVELAEQYAEGKWLKRDLAGEALKWAQNRAASMAVEDLPDRIGGELVDCDGKTGLKLPYLNGSLLIIGTDITDESDNKLTRYEQVFVLNHLAQGGRALPRGKWKGLVEFPNTVSKIVSMKSQVEEPLIKHFSGKSKELQARALALGATPLQGQQNDADVALVFHVFPRVPVSLMFWDAKDDEDFEAEAKLMFDETVVEHLDIESIIFMSERLRQLLCQ
jgi:hypothetical protein